MRLREQGAGKGVSGVPQPTYTVPGPAAAPLWARSPPCLGPDVEVQPAHPARLLCPSHWVCFLSLQLSSRDSPVTHHTLSWVGAAASCPPPSQEGDTLCPLLLKTQTKAQPGPGSPARGSGEPGPRPVCCVPLTCLSALGAQGEPVGLPTAGPRQGVALGRGLPGGGGVEREETPTQSRGVRYSGWTPLFPFQPPLSFSMRLWRPREGQPLAHGHTAHGGPPGACCPAPRPSWSWVRYGAVGPPIGGTLAFLGAGVGQDLALTA